MFILRDNLDIYTGKTYQYQGEMYPVFTNDIKEAKMYKSEKVATNSCNRLNEKFASGHTFKVFEIMG